MNRKSIPEEIKDVRKELGLTQLQFAKLLGASHSAVSKWEEGAREPLAGNYRRIKELSVAMSESARDVTAK